MTRHGVIGVKTEPVAPSAGSVGSAALTGVAPNRTMPAAEAARLVFNHLAP